MIPVRSPRYYINRSVPRQANVFRITASHRTCMFLMHIQTTENTEFDLFVPLLEIPHCLYSWSESQALRSCCHLVLACPPPRLWFPHTLLQLQAEVRCSCSRFSLPSYSFPTLYNLTTSQGRPMLISPYRDFLNTPIPTSLLEVPVEFYPFI